MGSLFGVMIKFWRCAVVMVAELRCGSNGKFYVIYILPQHSYTEHMSHPPQFIV